MNHTCSKCGTEVQCVPDAMKVFQIPDWELNLPDDLVSAIKAKAYKKTSGKGFRTLFFSKTGRQPLLVDLITNNRKSSGTPSRVWSAEVAPELAKLAEAGIRVLGCIAPPSSIDLAVTDLSSPFAVFAFVVVEDVPDIKDRLIAAGIPPRVYDGEGMVDTISPIAQDWMAIAGEVHE